MRRGGVDPGKLRDLRAQPLEHPGFERGHARGILRHARLREMRGGGEGGDLGHGLGPGAASALLRAADDEGPQPQAGADIERADALGGVDLVAADADEVRAERLRREGDFHKGLHRVGVQQRARAALAQHPRDARDIRHAAGLVVDHHQRDERRVLAQRGLHIPDAYRTVLIRLQARDFPALRLQQVEALSHRVVLDERGNNMPARTLRRLGPAEQGPVVALGAAGGKDQLLRGAAQRVRHGGARRGEQLRRLAPLGVGGAGVAVEKRHRLHGRLRRLRADSGGRGVVKIVFHLSSSLWRVLL